MKRTNLYILLFGVLIFVLTGMYSCDYISNPVEPVPPKIDTCESLPFPVTKSFRKVLVEDFTAHKCSNCPQAAAVARQLEETFHDSVIIVSVHSGAFAKPLTGAYAKNFKTEAGEAYDLKFGIYLQGYPNGLINRKGAPNNFVKPHGSWAGEVNSILRTPMEADVKMRADYNTSDSMVCLNVQTTFLKATPAGQEYNLCVMLLQDSIIAPQLDGNTDISNYVHRHVLRATITDKWGDDLTKGKTPVVNVPILKKYSFKLQRDYGYEGKVTPKGERIPCKRENCYLVAFVYEAGTYRILQAEEVKIIK